MLFLVMVSHVNGPWWFQGSLACTFFVVVWGQFMKMCFPDVRAIPIVQMVAGRRGAELARMRNPLHCAIPLASLLKRSRVHPKGLKL